MRQYATILFVVAHFDGVPPHAPSPTRNWVPRRGSAIVGGAAPARQALGPARRRRKAAVWRASRALGLPQQQNYLRRDLYRPGRLLRAAPCGCSEPARRLVFGTSVGAHSFEPEWMGDPGEVNGKRTYLAATAAGTPKLGSPTKY